jgi:hypothetical protein
MNKYILFGFMLIQHLFCVAVLGEELGLDTVRVITGGYEAELARINGTPLKGPRTDAVKAFVDRASIPYSIETVIWNRAMKQVKVEPRTLIYPLTRTVEREHHFDWIKEIDTHTYHLLGKAEVGNEIVSKEDIISGKYLAICEAATSNCDVLKQFGFPDSAIIRVTGQNAQSMLKLILDGRASFTMEDVEFYHTYVSDSDRDKLVKIGDYSITKRDYLAGYKTEETLKQHLMHIGAE